MNFPFYIARRYTISKSKNTAVNSITRISALGIVVGTTALFVIISVFGGLKYLSLSFTNATDPDLKLYATVGKSLIFSEEQEKQLANLNEVESYTKIVEERVLFYFDGKQQIAYIKGIDSLFIKVNLMQEQLIYGEWLEPETSQVVIGAGTMQKLSVGVLDVNRSLEVYVPKPGRGGINSAEDAFNKSNLYPVGVYSVNDDINSKYVFCDLGLAQELLQYKPNQLSAIELKLVNGASEKQVKEKLQNIFNKKITIKNRTELNDSLNKMLNAENLIVYLFCSLVVVMTLFCLVGALIMLILDKRENIKTLFNLGVEIKNLRKIFFYQGVFITSLGAFSGLFLGAIIILIQQHYQVIMINNTIPYPVVFTLENIIIVLVTIFTLGILASAIASVRVGDRLLKNS